MELRHLRYFAAVAEERHFGRAAQRLHMAQPPLSRQIQALEAELGFALFDRSRRRVELTTAGAVLHERMQRVFDSLDQAVAAARSTSQGKTGRVVIAYIPIAYAIVLEILRGFRDKAPEVELNLREFSQAEQMHALREGRVDIGFARAPIDDDTVAKAVVVRERLMIALPGDHRLVRRARIDLAELAREPFVMFPHSRAPGFYEQIIGICREAGFAPRVVQEASQLDLLSLVIAGFGVTILPESIRGVGRRGLVLRPIVGAPTSELLAVWRHGDTSPALHAFIAFIGKQKRKMR